MRIVKKIVPVEEQYRHLLMDECPPCNKVGAAGKHSFVEVPEYRLGNWMVDKCSCGVLGLWFFNPERNEHWYRFESGVLDEINLVIAAGSADGVLTTSAVLMNSDPEAEVIFCQAFTVDKIDPSEWKAHRKVIFVDLAVNNKDKSTTVDFLLRIKAAGHQILGVLDEHNAEDWQEAFDAAGLLFDDLAIKPVSQDKGVIKSSGALFLSLLTGDEGEEGVEKMRKLCEAADAADRMDFSTRFGGVVNQAVKSRISDDSRRVYLAKHFARNYDADETINGWIAEYEAILATHQEILGARQDLGDGVVRVNAVGKTIDMVTLTKTLYELGFSVVIADDYAHTPVGKTRIISLSIKPGIKVDAVAALKAAGVECYGFAAKANIKPEDEEAALAAIRSALKAATAACA